MGIEIELRTSLDEKTYYKILEHLSERDSIRFEKRCFVDFTTAKFGILDRDIEIKLRNTNGVIELVAKRGRIGSSIRTESVARILESELGGIVEILDCMGYAEGICCARKIARAKLADVEVSMQAVLDVECPENIVDQFIEVEFAGNVIDPASAIGVLERYLSYWGLKPMSESQWAEYVIELNRKASFVFRAGEKDLSRFQELGK